MSKKMEAVQDFYNMLEPGDEFHGRDLHRYVCRRTGESPFVATCLRYLRAIKGIKYTVGQKNKSHYRKII